MGDRRASEVLALSPSTAQLPDHARVPEPLAGPQCPPSVNRRGGRGWLRGELTPALGGSEKPCVEAGRGLLFGGYGGETALPFCPV